MFSNFLHTTSFTSLNVSNFSIFLLFSFVKTLSKLNHCTSLTSFDCTVFRLSYNVLLSFGLTYLAM